MQIGKKKRRQKITKFRRPVQAIVQKPAARLPVSFIEVVTFGTLSRSSLRLMFIYICRMDIVLVRVIVISRKKTRICCIFNEDGFCENYFF